jgi:hypothetical protein
MTTKEMIEVMQAYERGEEIEFCLACCEDDRWEPMASPLWNWVKFKYRVKPKKTKFKVGDVLVRLADEGLPLASRDICRISSMTTKEYGIQNLCKGGGEIFGPLERIDLFCVKADDVLWYWEYQDVSGEWEMTDARYTKSDLGKEVLGPNERETAAPLYALGFRLPEKIGD